MIVGLLADAHGNREALQVALATLGRHGAELVYFLGDAVGYLPGGEAIAELVSHGVVAVQGNHEAMLLEDRVPPDREPVYRLDETRGLLTSDERATIAGWPDRREIAADCGRLVMVHGSLDEPIDGYVYPDTPVAPLVTDPATTVFMGATHRPFIRRAGTTTYVNVGSCGLPRDRGDLGAACVFDDTTGRAEIIRFDIAAATRAALDRCGPVAPAVLAVYERREDFVGQVT